jgi:hypothetical protein
VGNLKRGRKKKVYRFFGDKEFLYLKKRQVIRAG